MTTQELLAELRASPTDLARLVATAARSPRREVVVASRTLQAWVRRDPQAWAKVVTWLAAHDQVVREI
jgi:hypothetical protein